MNAITAFLTNLIDYAGLFPPARLPMAEALTNYRAYRDHPDRWMLGPFIVPATRLAEVSESAGTWFTPDAPFRFSVLGAGASDWSHFDESVASDMAAITEFRMQHGDGVRVSIYETKAPAASNESLSPIIGDALNHIDGAGGLIPFFEVGIAPYDAETWSRQNHAIVGELGAVNVARMTPAGFKLRCGGVTPDVFPTAGQIASVLTLCRDRKVPLKATAGLHHPIRHYSDATRCMMHGFLNVIGAGVLAYANSLDAVTVAQIVADEDAGHFRFTEDAFAWQEVSADVVAIEYARANHILSYGSCSFDEPREDLQNLGMLPPT